MIKTPKVKSPQEYLKIKKSKLDNLKASPEKTLLRLELEEKARKEKEQEETINRIQNSNLVKDKPVFNADLLKDASKAMETMKTSMKTSSKSLDNQKFDQLLREVINETSTRTGIKINSEIASSDIITFFRTGTKYGIFRKYEYNHYLSGKKITGVSAKSGFINLGCKIANIEIPKKIPLILKVKTAKKIGKK